MSVVVDVQPLAAGEERNQSNVRRRVVEVPVADVMAEAIDGRGKHEDVHARVDGRCEESPPHADGEADERNADAEAEKAITEHGAVQPARSHVPPVPPD